MAYAKSGTLVANTPTTINLDSLVTVTVVNRSGSAEIWFTTDGGTPSAAGDNCHCVPNVAGASRTVKCRVQGGPTSTVSTTGSVVKLFSTGTPTYEIDGI